jgi:hypothetical protein
MIDLCLNLFVPYGPVRIYPRFNNKTGFEWQIEAELDSTFEFLLSDKQIAPKSDAGKKIVLSYLAGLFDAEGSVWLRSKGRFAPRLSFANKDLSMLDWIEQQLTRLGVHFRRSRPDKNGVYATLVWRNADVMHLLGLMPFKHPEKKAKTRLLLRFLKENFDLKQSWFALLSEIEFDRLEFIRLANRELEPEVRDIIIS